MTSFSVPLVSLTNLFSPSLLERNVNEVITSNKPVWERQTGGPGRHPTAGPYSICFLPRSFLTIR